MRFIFELALALGRGLPEVMSMTAAEFHAWRAYYNVYPFGSMRGDIQAGIVASTIANVNRPKNHQGYTAADFMLFKSKPPPDQIEMKISKFMSRYH